MKDLKNKIALVTGGGQGLGKATCEALAESGCIVISADIKDVHAQEVAQDLRKKGFKAEALKLDVSDVKSVQGVVETVAKEFGSLDILINNAAIDYTKPLTELTVQEFDRVLSVNLRGYFLTAKFAFPIMAKQKQGHIINVSSTAAKRTWSNASAYHATKWGVLGFSHALFTEARKVHVKVSAVIPGGMKTPFLLERFPDIDQTTLQDPRNVAQTIKFVLSQPDETIIPEVMVIPMNETSWP